MTDRPRVMAGSEPVAEPLPAAQRRLWLVVRRALLMIISAIEKECGVR